MMATRGLVRLGLAVAGIAAAFAIYMRAKGGGDPPERNAALPPVSAIPSAAPARAIEPPADDATEAWRSAMRSGAEPSPIAEEVRATGARSSRLAGLPEPDRGWVLGRASKALAVGQVSRELLLQHIDELASIRQFAVLEREAPYMPPEEPGATEAL
ncbi:MAG TPA: hypothetical protein VFD36_21160 [Kofleriaceae bacterium]|nr:hypothetical protein [Kofleriaceae bacterium]